MTRVFLSVTAGLALAISTLGTSTPALAETPHYDVRVDGLACPFCVRGLRKKLDKLPGTLNVEIDLEQARATFDVTPDTVLLPGSVRDAIRDAGFTPREITLTATGTVRGTWDDLRIEVGDGHHLRLHGGGSLEELRTLVQNEIRSIEITGLVMQSEDEWVLRVDTVVRQENDDG